MDGLMLEHVQANLMAFASDPVKAGIFASFLLAAILLFFAVRGESNLRRKRLLMHAHLLSIAAPLSLLGASLSCSVVAVNCAVTLSQTALLAFPLFLLIAVLFSFFLLPRLLRAQCRPLDSRHPLWKKVENEAIHLGVKRPVLLVDSSPSPVAYSFNSPTPSIVLSEGALQKLSSRELEAVALHELHHLLRNSPGFKLSASLYSLFLPGAVSSFSAELTDEERRADAFAASRQGTRRFVARAKAKFAAQAPQPTRV